TVYTSDDASIHDKTSLIGFALGRSDLKSSDIVVVGDTPEDIRAAKANGCRYLAVASGFHTLTELRKDAGKHARKRLSAEQRPKPPRPRKR
ncbi:MAG: HAD hydrolase-like protein, partial [Candidatus Diapherotrites archaeon]|nr:HAD hydrolase-like protein [Candidatus Diapherotrites archaeon]